jgi:HK97 family phage major capsid protein
MLAELRAQRATIATQMRALHDKAEKEERAFTADDDSTWNNLQGELDRIDQRMARLDKLAAISAPDPTELRAGGQEPKDRAQGGADGADGYAPIFRDYLRHGMDALDVEQRQALLRRRFDTSRMSAAEQRAFTAGTGNQGGFTVPQDFLNQLEIALRAYGGMMTVADVMRTDTGATLPMPTMNYTNVLATIIGEGAASNVDGTTPFGVANLGAFTYRSPMLQVSYEFLQDTSFGEQFIIDSLSGSIARAVNAHATVGTGTGQPRGVALDAVSGKVGLTGQTTSVIYDDLVDLVHSVDPAYRPMSQFMMHDTTVRQIRKIKDTSGRPIWLPGYESGVAVGVPDTLMGYGYQVNQDVAVMAANARSIMFGNFKKYKLRIVRDVTALRLVERYADNLQVGFMLFMRADGRLLDAGTNPVKFYQNSAT